MRIIAIVANIALLFFVCVLLASAGPPISAEDVLLVSLIVLSTVSNLIALYFAASSPSWLALFLKRKALEERKKIDELGKHADG
jgi:hypothetical protein